MTTDSPRDEPATCTPACDEGHSYEPGCELHHPDGWTGLLGAVPELLDPEPTPAPDGDRQATVTVAVHAPTAEDAHTWTRTIADLVTAEFGDSMRLSVTIGATTTPAAGSLRDRDDEMRQLRAELARAQRSVRRARGSENFMTKCLARQDDRVRGLTSEVAKQRTRTEEAEAALGQLRTDLEQTRETSRSLSLDCHQAQETNRRLNRRCQQAESRFAKVARAVADWRINERGTYVPLNTLNAIAKAVGIEVNPDRWQHHYQRVQELEAALARVRAFAGRLDGFAEVALKVPDRELYAALATALRTALDQEPTT